MKRELTATPAADLGVNDLLVLLKPRVMSLVIFTALVGMVVAPVSSSSIGLASLDSFNRCRTRERSTWVGCRCCSMMRQTRNRHPCGRSCG